MTATAIALRHAEIAPEIAACFPVMALLRPHLANADELVTRVARQRDAGYRLQGAWHGTSCIALAGYRPQENLMHGGFLYVDDLMTAESERGSGVGAHLLEAVMDEGRALGCHRLVLDTALDNVLGHRFYYRRGLLARGLRFSRPITPR